MKQVGQSLRITAGLLHQRPGELLGIGPLGEHVPDPGVALDGLLFGRRGQQGSGHDGETRHTLLDQRRRHPAGGYQFLLVAGDDPQELDDVSVGGPSGDGQDLNIVHEARLDEPIGGLPLHLDLFVADHEPSGPDLEGDLTVGQGLAQRLRYSVEGRL